MGGTHDPSVSKIMVTPLFVSKNGWIWEPNPLRYFIMVSNEPNLLKSWYTLKTI